MLGYENISQDTLTIIGAIFGLICGIWVGAQNIYAALYDHNFIDANAWKESEQNKMSPAMRLNVGIVGLLFLTIGVVTMVLYVCGVGEGSQDDRMALSSGAFIGTFFGVLILYNVIRGKIAT